MSVICNLFKPYNPMVIAKAMLAYQKNLHSFDNIINRDKLNTLTRYTLSTLDESDTIQKAIIDFNKSFDDAIQALVARRKIKLEVANNIKSKVLEMLNVELDEHQEDNSSDDTEDSIKDKDELLDTNLANLNLHIIDLYGDDSYSIINAMKESFSDAIIDCAFFNIVTKVPVPRSNVVLNKNIKLVKAKLFLNIVNFLKIKNPELGNLTMYDDSGALIGPFYYKVLGEFYKYIKGIDNLSDTLYDIYSKLSERGLRDLNTTLYKNIVAKLLENQEFSAKFNKKFTNNFSKNLAKTTLYEANNLSSYFFTIKELANKVGIKEISIDGKVIDIENLSFNNEESNVLTALSAYTLLTHFDELLREQFGLEIDTKNGEFGLEFGSNDKYEFHQDNAHLKKSWQSSESIESEKYISRLVDRLLDQVKIYGFRTKEYLNKSVTSSSVINAARNFIDDLLCSHINFKNWGGSSIKQLTLIKNIVLHAINLHDDPEYHFLLMLELLFESDLANNLNITSNMSMNQFDLDTLYSLYRTALDKNNNNSLISQENKNAVEGPINLLSREIAALVDRNTPAYYTEVSFDETTGEVIVKTKKRFFNNLEVYKLRIKINNKINNRTLNLSKTLDSKYSFEAYPTTTKIAYIAHLDNNLSLEYNSENILKFTEKGSFNNKELFKTLLGINILNFRLKILKGESLSEDEQTLKSLLTFIDDLLELNILTSIGLLQLNIFLMLKSSNIEDLTKLAIKAAFVNHLYALADVDTLKNYLSDNKFGIINILRENPLSKLFSTKFNNLKINIVPYSDNTIQNWADAYSILTGQASKATIKNNEGNSTPNNTVSKLGTDAIYYFNKLKNTNVQSLYFVQNDTKIVKIHHDLEATSLWAVDKQVKNFTQRELFFHAIFNKFYGSYINTNDNGNNTFIVQPTVFSDKTTFLNYEISSKLFKNEDIMEDSDYQNTIINEYINTIGNAYKSIYKNSQNNLKILLEAYNTANSTNYTNVKDMLWNLTEDLLVLLAADNNVDITKDADYRIVKDSEGNTHLTTNELLEYYVNELYNSPENLRDFLLILKNLFALQLIDTGNIFLVINFKDNISNYLKDRLPEDIKSKNPIILTIIKVFKKDERIEFFKNWVDASTGRLIICKSNGENFINTGIINGDVELNPLLDKFFYIDGFLSNNLRMSLTGSEINHPDKAFNTLFDRVKETETSEEYKLLGLNPRAFDKVKSIIDLVHSIDDLRTLQNSSKTVQKDLDTIYLKTITKIANVALGTLFKRNVIIPATLLYCELNTINGISPTIKCAVIYDEKAPVFNYRGTHEKSIDSSDGSAKINPFQSILENKALGTLAVGFTKKPIWHAYDASTGTAFLAKFATNTITNEAMLDSMLAHTSLYKLFKKMTNLLWLGDVDLTLSIFKKNPLGNRKDNSLLSIWFNTSILGNVLGDNTNKLLYKDKYGTTQQIHGLDYTLIEGKRVYYTLELKYIKGASVILPKPKYHLYLDLHYTFNSEEEVSQFLLEHPEAHTINSLFELHDALGGVYCVNSKGESSEFNNEVVVNYMNNVGTIKEDAESKLLSLRNYNLPLKKYHIGYALNNTAVKNGAKNINKSSAWYDDSELHYYEVSSAGLGIQMNADHDIINSELTEFSLVITATSAYGYTYDNTNEIFLGLASASLSTTRLLRNSIDNFINQNFDNPELARSDLYDAIGRIIMTSATIKDKESLQGIIMEAVNSVFYKSKNHTNDKAKIPFSDPNIYSDFIATLTSTINKEAIKRKHPGSGCVMVPAYNMIQYYEIGGNKYMFDDILLKAETEYKNNLISLLKTSPKYDAKTNKIDNLFIIMASTLDLENKVKELNLGEINNSSDITQFKNTLVSNYLNKLLLNKDLIKSKSWFMPTDVVNIVDELGIAHTFALDSMDDYYKFKLGLNDIEVVKNVNIKVYFPKNKYVITDNNGNKTTLQLNEDGKWQVDNTALSEVAALIKGSILLPDGTVVNSSPLLEKLTYIENVTRPKNLRPSTIRWQDSDTGEWFNIFDSNVIKNSYLTGTTNPKGVLEELNNILQGVYTKADGTLGTIKEGSLDNLAAELIMSNIYKDKFGIENESLSQVLEEGEDYFKRKFNRLSTPANANYDLAFIKDSGNCTLIRFGNVVPNEFVQLNNFTSQLLYTNENGEVYLMKSNLQLFKIGKWVDTEATYKNGNFYIKGKVLDKNKFRLKDPNNPTSILKLVTYVNRYNYINKKVNKNGNVSYKTDTMYLIAPIEDFIEGLGNVLDAVKQRAKIIADIYLADKYKLAQINSLINNAKRLSTVVSGTSFILTNLFIPEDVKNLLKTQIEETSLVDFKGKELTEEDKKKLKEAKKANWKTYLQRLTEFLNKEAHRRYISFLDSLNFIASRIPAQSLLSFMTMKNIAWTKNSKNMAYVSHFLTYLLGSDY